MKRLNTRRLSLSREVLRRLGIDQMSLAAGGGPSTACEAGPKTAQRQPPTGTDTTCGQSAPNCESLVCTKLFCPPPTGIIC